MLRARSLLFLLVLAGCAPTRPAADAACDLEGAWEVVSLRLTAPDGTVEAITPGDPPGLKVLSRRHWSFVEQTDDPANPTSGGGGRYRVEGDRYIEEVDYHAATSFIGQTLAFECEMTRDGWIQRGMLPGGTYLEEVYRRAR